MKIHRKMISHHKNAEGLLNLLHSKPALFNYFGSKIKQLSNWGQIAEKFRDSQREPFIHKTHITLARLKCIGCAIHRKQVLMPST